MYDDGTSVLPDGYPQDNETFMLFGSVPFCCAAFAITMGWPGADGLVFTGFEYVASPSDASFEGLTANT